MSGKRSAAKKRAAAAANAAPAPSSPSDIATRVGRLSLEQNPRKRNIVKEFDSYFGNTNDLANWQRLCYDLDIEGDLPSISKCRKVCFIELVFQRNDLMETDNSPEAGYPRRMGQHLRLPRLQGTRHPLYSIRKPACTCEVHREGG